VTRGYLAVVAIRSVRTEMNDGGPRSRWSSRDGRRSACVAHVTIGASPGSTSFAMAPPKGAAVIVVGETTLALPLEGVIDMGAERRRLAKEIAEAEGDAAKMDAKLANPQFVARAKPEAVEETRERKSDLEARARRLKAALVRIEG
jgi:valyl-tRNA synthetase